MASTFSRAWLAKDLTARRSARSRGRTVSGLAARSNLRRSKAAVVAAVSRAPRTIL